MKTPTPSQRKHTAGPWKIDSGMGRLGLDKIYTGEASWIADVAPSGLGPATVSESKSNAYLIAAAPDLLAACEGVFDAWLRGRTLHAGSPQYDVVRDALRKAKGGGE